MHMAHQPKYHIDMKKTFALAALAACTGTLSATVIVPVSVTGPAGGAGSSTNALINSASLRDPGDSPVVLITGDALATAQLFEAGDDRASFAEIAFRGTAVPEPSFAALLGLGGLALILRRRK